MTEHLQFEEQCALYAVGALDAAEQATFESHLADCPGCNSELITQQRIVHMLPYSLPPHPLPPGLKNRLLERLGQPDGQPTKVVAPPEDFWTGRQVITWLTAGSAVALLVVTLGSSLVINQMQTEMQATMDAMTRQLQDKEAALQVQQRQLDQQKAALSQLYSPELTTFQLAGMKTAPEATARVLWNRRSNIWVFLVKGLPPPPKGKTYQLWFINKQAQKISAGTFTPLPTGPAPVEFNVPPNAQALEAAAVTLEPAGGVAQPTGDIYLLGKPAGKI